MSLYAAIFPGQGSHAVGMLKDFMKNESYIREKFEEASDILGFNFYKLIKYGPSEELNITYFTQPIILTASYAIWKIWIKQCKKVPVLFAGHSLGEYSALLCANSIDFQSAVKLVYLRGKLMQKASPIGLGAMSVITGLSIDLIKEICNKLNDKGHLVSPSNFNAPDQIVISGYKKSVELANIKCKKFGANVIQLPISVPAHCLIMKSISNNLANILEKIIFKSPKIKIINNVDLKIELNPKNIRKALIKQIYSPVRWLEIIQYFLFKKVNLFIEIGPGNILANINRRISKNISTISINDTISLSKAIKLFN